MLFDEKELNVLDNNESRTYFKEILQSYYSQNYRATIVLLYSFVIYDLFIKLQTMANEGDKKANNKLNEINTMIADDEKYSMVENAIIEFYKDNCPLYFNRFVEDIEYLKNCRNKCAHLKVNDNSLYVPSDYHARMLICSMFDNILSVKAPFIMDLFSFAQSDVEKYSSQLFYIPDNGVDESIITELKNKYFKRMTYDSIKKSYKTFIRLLLVSDDENCKKNVYGLYAFTYALTDYIIKNGYAQFFHEADIQAVLSKVEVDALKENDARRNALISIMVNYPAVMDCIRMNHESVFDYTSSCVILNPKGLNMYKVFNPRSEKTMYTFFLENKQLKQPCYTGTLYRALNECHDFDIDQFMKEIVSEIPPFNAFHDADVFMSFFMDHLEEMSIDAIEEVLKIYKRNPQCTNRGRHTSDMKVVDKHLAEHRTNCTEGTIDADSVLPD